MTRPTLTVEPMMWDVEKSFIVELPNSFEVSSINELREYLQHHANRYRPSEGKPVLGELSYRYEVDGHERVTVVHVHFINRKNLRQRFARLRRRA